VGQRSSRTRLITHRDVELFTELCGDRNPLHYDPAVAKRSRFGEIIVQGGVTTALLNAVVAEQLPGPGSVFLNTCWDFRAPVRPGDEITAVVEVIEARVEKPITRLRCSIARADGVIAVEGTAICYTDPLAE
jgi:acyl dehydratase